MAPIAGRLAPPLRSSTSASSSSLLLPTRRHAWTSPLPLPSALRQLPSKLLFASPRLPIPLSLLSTELGLLRSNVQSLLGSGHPALDTIAKYYFKGEGGKHVRPMVVLLMSQATNGLAPGWERMKDEAKEREERAGKMGEGGVDEPLESRQILNDDNPDLDLFGKAKNFFKDPMATILPTNPFSTTTSPTTEYSASDILLPTQRRLAEITEMIHVASLLHDDVIDLASTRRSLPSAPNLFGNKLSILSGDFLLARASLSLSRLGSVEVVELVASVLANLVEGEVMQMKGNLPEGMRGDLYEDG
ncbi:hypothetical protein P7C70_g8278, partial [Phenoliferia sp. Uapishka_3]